MQKARKRQGGNAGFRITLLIITIIAIFIALDEKSVIFTIVSFAWAGFGATFGPFDAVSLFWKRINRAGAVAGMLGGGGMVFFWKLVIRPLGGAWNIYELHRHLSFPAYLLWRYPFDSATIGAAAERI